MAKKRKKRVQYTEAQRAKVLAAAKAENLTALQVQKKFGVTPVTYYSWRKKSGLTRGRGGAATVPVPVRATWAAACAPRCRPRCGRSCPASCGPRSTPTWTPSSA